MKYPIEPSGVMKRLLGHVRKNPLEYLLVPLIGIVLANDFGPKKISYMDYQGEKIRVEESFVFSSPTVYKLKNGEYKRLSTIHEEEEHALKLRHIQEERLLKEWAIVNRSGEYKSQ